MWRREYFVLLPWGKQNQWVDIGETGCGLIFSCLPLGQQSMAVSSQQDGLMWEDRKLFLEPFPRNWGDWSSSGTDSKISAHQAWLDSKCNIHMQFRQKGSKEEWKAPSLWSPEGLDWNLGAAIYCLWNYGRVAWLFWVAFSWSVQWW